MFAGVCSLGNVCNMAPRHYEAEGIPPSSSLPHPACITPCIRSWPPLHGFWPPSSRCAIASIQEYFYPLRGRTRSVVNSKPWITSSKFAGGHLPKTMKLNLSRRTDKKKKKRKIHVRQNITTRARVKVNEVKNLKDKVDVLGEPSAWLSHSNCFTLIHRSSLPTYALSARFI